MKCDFPIVLLLLSLSSVSIVYSAPNCCKKSKVRFGRTCDDGSEILPKCDGSRILLNNQWGYLSKYFIHTDDKGEYLENYVGKYLVRSPNFCVGERRRIYKPNVTDPVAVICGTNREHFSQINITNINTDDEESFLFYFTIADIFLNSLSCSLLVVAFYVYYLVIPIRQVEDDCLLNIAGCLTLTHAAFLYDIVSDEGLVPNLCITNLYFMNYCTLSAFNWYALFMYYQWKKYKTGAALEEATILKQFHIIGYGVPTLLIILINIHAHLNKLYSAYSWETDCLSHQILIEDIYILPPLLFAIGSNCYFWKDLERHSETKAVKTTEDDAIKKKINSMLTLNRRLFLVLPLPWLLYTVLNGTYGLTDSSIFDLAQFFTEVSISCIGGIVALILVMSRARVWKCVIHKYENYEWLQKWQPSDQEEISNFPDKGSSNVSRTFPQDV